MIGLVEAGAVEASYRGAFHRLEKGALIVVQPEQVIGFDPIPSGSEPSRICVHCPSWVLQNVTDEIAGRHFTCHFKRLLSFTPATYQKNVLSG